MTAGSCSIQRRALSLWLAFTVLALAAAVAASEGWLEPVRRLDAQGQTREALAELESGMARRSAGIEAELLRGVLLAKLGRTAEARELFQRLIRQHPERPEAYNNLAVMYAAGGDYDTAVEILKQGLETHASYRTTYENLSRVYGKLASEAYSEALGDKRIDAEPLRLALINSLGEAPAIAAPPVRTAEAQPATPPPAAPPAPARSAPAPPAETAAPVPTPAADPQAVWRTVEAWAAAWAGQRPDEYLSYYAAQFRPANGSSRADWERLRRRRLTAPGNIDISLALLEVDQPEPGRAVARFVQSYRSDRFSDTVTKALELVDAGDGWKIVSEAVEEVRE